ncbi:hypothetical protein [Roseateles sp. P5_D6]
MSSPATPVKTQAARQLLAGPRSNLTVPMRMLLINVDGRRRTVELQDIARSLNLAPNALEELQRDGLISGLAELSHAPEVMEQPPIEVKAALAPASSADDLRRLMRAKMFAFDLACRMLAGRDAELRASAREVNSESRFLDWLAEASTRIETASDGERAQLFRDRVAQAAA